MEPEAKTDEEDDATVAVVIPAYNAVETLAETLESVLNQTHTALDIVVVDDGSTDLTREIAEAFAERDPRVRVLSRPNGGVARARNTGIEATTGEFVAPVDADDLWHPEKIARQLKVMRAGGPELGFVYTPYRIIDEQSRIIGINSVIGPFHGWVYLRHILINFVGNGSSLLIRRAALEDVGGYDPSLHDHNLQGTEDFLLQLLIARRWQVDLVPEYLVGYRKRRGAMSEDSLHMALSRLACIDIVAGCYPETPLWLLNHARARVHTVAFLHCLLRRRFRDSLFMLYNSICEAPLRASINMVLMVLGLRATTVPEANRANISQPFLSVQSSDGKGAMRDFLLRRQLRRLAALEEPPISPRLPPREIIAHTDKIIRT